jgi:hypothetical protein
MSSIRLGILLVAVSALVAAANEISDESLTWRSNYRAAMAEARTSNGLLFLWFEDSASEQDDESHLAEMFARCLAEQRHSRFIPIRLSTDAALVATSDTKQTRILDHPAFEELLGRSGVAIIDMRNERSPHFHHVVSVYPFVDGPLSEQQLTTMLELPTGSLTQRTLVWAVRTHRDQPASTSGEATELLMHEAASHSRHQAAICLQGHHRWDERFHAINARLPPDLVAQEVCAESWPGESLVEAAQGCVHAWRQSSGHWDAVSTHHRYYGYDMQRGANGIWYATGVFARQK